MLLSLAYTLLRFLADVLLVRTRSDVQLRAEILALRHQLRVLERKVGKPRWHPHGDRGGTRWEYRDCFLRRPLSSQPASGGAPSKGAPPPLTNSPA